MAALWAAVPAGVVLALTVGLVLHAGHAGQHETHAPGGFLHWLRDSSLAIPLAVASVAFAARAAAVARLAADDLATRLLFALAGAVAYAALSVPGSAAHS